MSPDCGLDVSCFVALILPQQMATKTECHPRLHATAAAPAVFTGTRDTLGGEWKVSSRNGGGDENAQGTD